MASASSPVVSRFSTPASRLSTFRLKKLSPASATDVATLGLAGVGGGGGGVGVGVGVGVAPLGFYGPVAGGVDCDAEASSFYHEPYQQHQQQQQLQQHHQPHQHHQQHQQHRVVFNKFGQRAVKGLYFGPFF